MIDQYRQTLIRQETPMTTMISEVYSAFKTAGVPEQEARKAAEALSAENLATRNTVAEDKSELSANITAVEQRLSANITAVEQRLSGKIAAVDQKLSDEIAKVRQEAVEVKWKMSVMHWMLSFVLIAVVLPLAREIILFWL